MDETSVAEWIGQLPVDETSPHSPRIQRALQLAERLLTRAIELQTPQERKQQTELDRLMQNPGDKATLMQLTDQAFRSQAVGRAADQLIHVLDVQGVPRFFSPVERTMLRGFQSFGAYLPGVAVPLVKDRMQKETANVILPAEPEMLAGHLNARRQEGVRMNVNFLGESLLGEEEAEQRLQQYLAALQLPEIEVISVKISTIDSQISTLARSQTVQRLCDRLELLYRAAAKERYRRRDGVETSKFVYLDMEEYRDMTLTAEVFMATLDRPGLEQARAGIALQAYLPDSLEIQRTLNAWAARRVSEGRSPVTVRIVKGANLEMERVDASVYSWPQAPFKTKLETDANYKRMLHEGIRAEQLDAVHLGIASHNLFDVAYGLALAAEVGAGDRVQFEMLEGMANHQRRALFEVTHNLLLYAPACRQEDFVNAIGYLIRRLDENTGPENFLRHTFRLQPGGDDWRRLERGFLDSFALLDAAPSPRRRQDRLREEAAPPAAPPDGPWWKLENEPDTDFSLPVNGRWAEELLARWEPLCGDQATDVPLVIAGEMLYEGREIRFSHDPSRPEVEVARVRQASSEDIQTAIRCAVADPDGWRSRSASERHRVLRDAASRLRRARGDLIGAALADAGKTIAEADPEVSEAVDFVEFYSRCGVHEYEHYPHLQSSPCGVVAVVSPWNFPIAIPCGGVAAALAAGNTVLLKPASDSALPAWLLCCCFWEAGVPRTALQFVPCPGHGAGATLVTHPDVDAVILTGGTATALQMLAMRPEMNLLAETGGKNATIITALSDRDQAIKHVLHSAFGHSGQKCSATSFLVLEEEVYQDPAFRDRLCDAVSSLKVGSAWELQTRIGPLIRPPSGVLEVGLKELEGGESWAVLPRISRDNPRLCSPGVKWGVRPGSFTHLTEFFGPLLGVMRARNLAEAIQLVNETGYGLTSGLESLDDREQTIWRDGILAGNLYVNRPTTGAVVLRQPFGGMGKSSVGPGIKAGGPHYVTPLMRRVELGPPPRGVEIKDPLLAGLHSDMLTLIEQQSDAPLDELQQVVSALASYDLRMRQEYGRAHDHFQLIGQDNLRRYLPVGQVRIRVDPRDSWFDTLARAAAAEAAGCRIVVSQPPGLQAPAVDLLERLTEAWGARIEFVEESERQLAQLVRERLADRVRYAGSDRLSAELRAAVADSGAYVAAAPVMMEGRIELLWYLREQSISDNYHRYGNLGARGGEPRAETR